MHRSHAQASADFLVTFIIALAVFIFLFTIAGDRTADFGERETQLRAKSLAEHFASSVNSVSLAGVGARITIMLPATLEGEVPYAINLHSSQALVEILWTTPDAHRYTVPIVGYSGPNLTNINEAITITNNGTGSSINTTQQYFDCNSFCFGEGYSYGICRQGASTCVQNGEVFENKGNHFCTGESSGVCCCGY